MKVVAQTRDVVAMGMANQEGVDVEATLIVPLKPASQVFGDVRRVVIVVVRLAADIDVDEDVLTIVEAHQNHVSVGDGEEGERGGHGSFPYWICSADVCVPRTIGSQALWNSGRNSSEYRNIWFIVILFAQDIDSGSVWSPRNSAIR